MKQRKTMVGAACAALLLGAAGCVSSGRSPGAPDIKVVTYNIQAGAGNLDRIADEIRRMDADLVALQEVDVHWHQRSNFADQATELAKALSVEMRFAPIYGLPGGEGRPMREFGVALLSKYPIERWSNDSLMRLSTQAANVRPSAMPGLLRATVIVRGHRIEVLTAHLDYRSDPSVRREQVGDILRALGPPDSIPRILAGDLNATPDAPELQPLFTRLRDVWHPKAGPGHTYPAVSPTKRVDYILVSDHFQPIDAYVAGAAVADHRPVVATVRLVLRVVGR